MEYDTGHVQLIADIATLLREAEQYEFHDFKNDKYPAPKMVLVEKLNDLATRVKDGKYDN